MALFDTKLDSATLAKLAEVELGDRNLRQYRFDPLTYEDQFDLPAPKARELALSVRNAALKLLKADGLRVKGTALPGQLRKYAGLGQSDGRVRTVFYVNVL